MNARSHQAPALLLVACAACAVDALLNARMQWHGGNLDHRWLSREKVLSTQAMLEAGLSSANVSSWGNWVTKFPMSLAKRYLGNKHRRKQYRFIYVGPAFGPCDVTRKAWLKDFVKNNFDHRDYLQFTDCPANYTRLGAFDHSVTSGTDLGEEFWDLTYYDKMADSLFALGAGGCVPYSMKFYEAAMAGSIPVVHDPHEDAFFSADASVAWVDQLRYSYMVVGTEPGQFLQYRQDVVSRNMDMFRRFQTFAEGDHYPDTYSDNSTFAKL